MSIDTETDLPQSQAVSHTLEARASVALAQYLRRAGPLTPDQELMVRDTWMTAYAAGHRAGGREASEAWTELCTALSDRLIQTALAVLLQFVQQTPTQRAEAWRDIRRA